MKTNRSVFRLLLVLGGLGALSGGCVVGDGYISGGAAIHYGPFRLWFYDRPWLDGGPRWHDGMFVHPPSFRGGGRGRWPHIPDRPRVFNRP